MKKLILSGIVLIIVTVLAGSVITACIDPDGDIYNPFYDFRIPHVHEWGEWILSRDATCIEDGELIRACVDDEGHIETKPIPKDPIAHNWEVREDKNYVHPTCTEPGYAFQRCTLCEKIDPHREIPPLGHEFELYELTTIPNCTEPGVNTACCVRQTSGCDATDEYYIPVDPDAHVWNDEYEVTTFSTCSAKGEETDACAFNAAHIRTRETDEDSDAHDWYEIYFETAAATCMVAGEETRYCGYNIAHTQSRETAIDPDAHTFDTYLTLAAATCSTEGEERGTCVHNRAHVPDRRVIPIDPDAHEYGEWHLVGMVGVAATCTEAGEELRACAINTAHIDRREIYMNPDAHNWNNNYRMTTAPTCVAPGESTDTCRNNEAHTRTQNIPIDTNAHGWNNSYQVTTAATCEGTGVSTDACKFNAAHTRDRAIAALGHNWNDNYQVTTAATCTATGILTDRCARDNAHTRTQTLAINPDGHSWGPFTVTRPATCTTTGTQWRTCAYNGEHVDSPPIAINSNAHLWPTVNDIWDAMDNEYVKNITNPTCARTGSATLLCIRDQRHTTTCVLPLEPDEHEDYSVDGGVVVPATCKDTGWNEWRCSNYANCRGNIERQIPIDPNAHNYATYTVTTAATCLATGEETAPCTRDGTHTKGTRTIAIDLVNGHNWPTRWTTTTAATCVATGSRSRTCTRSSSHVDTQTIAVNPNAHDWGPWGGEHTNHSYATCSTEGYEERICNNLVWYNSHKDTRILPIDPNEHAFNNLAWVYNPAPTATTNGTRYKVCSRNSEHHVGAETAYATGTAGLQYDEYAGGGGYYVVNQGTTSGAVYIPSYRLTTYPAIGSGMEYYKPVRVNAGSISSRFDANITSLRVFADHPDYASQGGILYDKARTSIVLVPKGITGAITIPASVTSVGGVDSSGHLTTFDGCAKLTEINVDGNNPNYRSFKGILLRITETEVYEGGAYNNYYEIIRAPEGLSGDINLNVLVTGTPDEARYSAFTQSIAAEAFLNCTKITSLMLPNSIRSIGRYAFQSCTNILNLYVQQYVTTVGDGLFAAWTSQQTIHFDGRANKAAVDAAWGTGSGWDWHCNATYQFHP